MGCPLYLAMTAAEFSSVSPLPSHTAWMACHFSPYGQGISNPPKELPEDSMLILNDRIPVKDHDPALIVTELLFLVERFHTKRLLLDLQRPNVPQTGTIVKRIVDTLPCEVGVSHHYTLPHTPVFVPPIPLDATPQEYFAPWQGQQIWLEMTTEPLCLEIRNGSCQEAQWHGDKDAPDQWDATQFCHYQISTADDHIQFLLYRNSSDIDRFLNSLNAQGVTCGIGLYQEFHKRKTALQM